MIYWLSLFFIELSLLYLYHKARSKKGRVFALWSIILGLVYFSGFRDGLGMDYWGYKDLCEREVYSFSALLLSEPVFRGIQSFCYNTEFSAVLLFIVSAFLVCAPSLYVYSKYINFTISAFVFMFFTDIYLSSMNIVSQFSAAGVILFGYYFYMKGNNKKNILIVLVSIFCGMLLHLSSVFMLLPLLFNRKKINVLLWFLLIVSSYIIPIDLVLRIPVVENLVVMLDYSDYFNYTSSGLNKLSVTNLYLHLLLLPFLLQIKRIINGEDAEKYIFLIKMYAMYLILNNLATGSLTITYRLAVFFVLFVPLLLTKLPLVINKSIACCLIVIPMLSLMLIRLSIGDRLTVPDRILPIESIYDKYYKPYENPNE